MKPAIPATALFALLAGSSVLRAQAPTSAPAAMGSAAAERESIAPYFLIGVLGGSGMGVTATHYLRADRSETPYRYGVAGVAIVIGAGIAIEIGHGSPDPRMDAVATAAYQQAFRDRVTERRRNALTIGTAAGVGAGVLIHVLLSRAQ